MPPPVFAAALDVSTSLQPNVLKPDSRTTAHRQSFCSCSVFLRIYPFFAPYPSSSCARQERWHDPYPARLILTLLDFCAFLLGPTPSSLSLLPQSQSQRLLKRHGCAEQGGSYVNYPVFVASFTAAVRFAEPASAVAAVAAATAANASSAPSAAAAAAPADKNSPTMASRTVSGTVSGAAPARRTQGSGEPIR